MASSGPENIDDLVRAVEGTLGEGHGQNVSRRRRSTPPAQTEGGKRGPSAVRMAALSAAAVAAVVFVAFALVPFLGAISGAAGAFLGVFLVALVNRLRSRF